jgi:hypothetical protein
MHEWLEGLQKSAKRTVAGVGPEDIRRAETECGVPFPEELGALYRAFDGGELQGEVTLFPLHGAEGTPSVLEKTRLKLESLPAAGVWRIGVKGPHRQLFAARKSAMVEQADSPLPGWAESLSADDWIYGTWETEARELRLYRSLPAMLEVLVPPAEVEEFGDRTYARALSAVQGALSDLSVEYEEGETPVRASDEEESEEDEVEVEGEERGEEDEASGTPSREELRQLVVAAAQRRVERLRQPAAVEQEPAAPAEGVTELAIAGARQAAKKAAAVVTGAAKKVAARALKATGVKAPAKKATPEAKPAAKAPARESPATRKAATKKAPAKTAAKKAVAKKAPAKKAAVKKAPAKKAAAKKAPAKKAVAKARAKKAAVKKAPAKTAAKKAAAKKAPAKKAASAKRAPARKAASTRSAGKKGAARGRR